MELFIMVSKLPEIQLIRFMPLVILIGQVIFMTEGQRLASVSILAII
jgi:hypothetical protein